MKIAILEDNPGMGRMLQLNLENAGYEAHTFQTARDFLSFFALSNIDLLITDYRLMTEQGKSNLSGADVIRHVRTISPELPAILISAAPIFELQDAVRDIPGVVILQKFFKMKKLLETIQTFSR